MEHAWGTTRPTGFVTLQLRGSRGSMSRTIPKADVKVSRQISIQTSDMLVALTLPRCYFPLHTACPTGCLSCAIPSFSITSIRNDTTCTACQEGWVLQDGQCVQECGAGFFFPEGAPNLNGTCQGEFCVLARQVTINSQADLPRSMQPAIQQSARRVTPPPHSVHPAPNRTNSPLPPANACRHALPARSPTTSSDDAYLVPPTVPPARLTANASLARP